MCIDGFWSRITMEAKLQVHSAIFFYSKTLAKVATYLIHFRILWTWHVYSRRVVAYETLYVHYTMHARNVEGNVSTCELVLSSRSLIMKRGLSCPEDGASSSKQRQTVSYSTFQKWQAELYKDSQTITWFECDKTATGTITALKCGTAFDFSQ